MFGGRLGVIHAFLAPNIILSVALCGAAVVFFFLLASPALAPLSFSPSRVSGFSFALKEKVKKKKKERA